MVLYENYRIPILEEDLLRKALKTPDFSDDTYVNKEVFSCSVLRRVRKNDKYQSLHSLIDDFAVRNECLQFFLNPIEFEKIDKIEPVWVCYCENWIIQNLLENRVIKEKVKEYITNDTLGKREFDHMWKLL